MPASVSCGTPHSTPPRVNWSTTAGSQSRAAPSVYAMSSAGRCRRRRRSRRCDSQKMSSALPPATSVRRVLKYVEYATRLMRTSMSGWRAGECVERLPIRCGDLVGPQPHRDDDSAAAGFAGPAQQHGRRRPAAAATRMSAAERPASKAVAGLTSAPRPRSTRRCAVGTPRTARSAARSRPSSPPSPASTGRCSGTAVRPSPPSAPATCRRW